MLLVIKKEVCFDLFGKVIKLENASSKIVNNKFVFMKTDKIQFARHVKLSKILNLNVNDWSVIFRSTCKLTVNKQIREFQFKLLHDVIPLNVYLAKCKFVSTVNCCFCNTCPETCEHFFFNCNIVKNFYKEVCSFLDVLDEWSILKWENMLFGNYDGSLSMELDIILLYGKYHVYCCKYKSDKPNVLQFISFLKCQSAIEAYFAHDVDKYKIYFKKW